MSENEHFDAFRRFSGLIKKNLRKVKDVYVYTTVEKKYGKQHFLNISNLVWDLREKYSLGGI